MSEDRSVAAAVRRDLDALADRAPALAESGLALASLAVAARIDDPDTSPTAIAALSRALAENLDRLRELVPPAKEADGVDVLAAQRAKRIA